jgi:hypothetical protein
MIRQPAAAPTLELAMRPEELVAGWRPGLGRLLATTRAAVRREQRVVARVVIVGTSVAATIAGRVASATLRDGQTQFELVPDESRVRALERLVEIARGGAVAYPPRSPRCLATMPAVVAGPGGTTYMNTFSVSERGCGLTWSGPVPPVGAPMEMRLGAGKQVASVRGVVCWTARSGRASTVGVHFVAGHTVAWATMFQDLRRAGAPAA